MHVSEGEANGEINAEQKYIHGVFFGTTLPAFVFVLFDRYNADICILFLYHCFIFTSQKGSYATAGICDMSQRMRPDGLPFVLLEKYKHLFTKQHSALINRDNLW